MLILMTDTYNQFDPTPAVDAQYFTAQPASLSTFDRIIAVFTSPKEAFAGIEIDPKASTWLLSFLSALLLTGGALVLRYYVTDAPQREYDARHAQYTKMLNSNNQSAEFKQYLRQKMNEDSPNNHSFGLPLSIILGSMIIAFFFSGMIFFVLARFVFASEDIPFHSILIASALTFIISSVGDIVNLILQSITYNSSLLLAPSLFVGDDIQSPAFTVTSQLSLFKVWDLIAFSIAFASIIRRPRTTAYLAVFGTWLLRILILGGLSIWGQSRT